MLPRSELKHKKIAVLMGGLSAEREISLRTGQAVLNALLEANYNATAIDVKKNLAQQLLEAKTELAFIALHGRHGEDGTVQGLLELMQIPYTGSGVLSSSLAMNKAMTKQVLLYNKLTTPDFKVYQLGEDLSDMIESCQHFPLVVKPAREGSTIGVSVVGNAQQLNDGILKALECDDLVLIEEFIKGDEVTVGVLNGEALPIIQVIPKRGFYDYRSKYTPGQTEYLVPAPLACEQYGQLQEASVAACRALHCRGAARVDFMIRKDQFYCLEVNTIPGMTETSLLPKAAAESRIDFIELVLRILEDAGLNK